MISENSIRLTCTIPRQYGAIGFFPVFGVNKGRQVNIIGVKAAKIGNKCQIRPGSSFQLFGKLFPNNVVADQVYFDINVRINFFIAINKLGQNGCFGVDVAHHHVEINRLRCGRPNHRCCYNASSCPCASKQFSQFIHFFILF